jgi:hypothetical protein
VNRTALASLMVGAVALVAVPVVVITAGRAGQESSSSPTTPTSTPPGTSASSSEGATATPDSPRDPFTPAAYDDWRSSISRAFAIAEGLPADGGDFERSAEPVAGSFCGTRAFPTEGLVDAIHDGATGPEFADVRSLLLYVDDTGAHELLRKARKAVLDCPEELHGVTDWLHEVTNADLGEESLRIVRTYETDGRVGLGATVWHVVRVGNAVLLTARTGEFLAGETLGQGIAQHERTIAPIVTAMCEFSAVGCTAGGDIPDDFPLAAGWPDDSAAEPGPQHGLRGPNRSLEPLAWEMCDDSFTATGARDRLRADWNNVEDYRGRALLTFTDADAAVSFSGSLVSFWRSCPEEEQEDGYVSLTEVRSTDVGGESWALLRWSEYDGSPAVGLTVVHVTRLGRAVLIDQTSNEGSRTFADEQVDAQSAESAPVVSAMCRFTEAGC